MFVSRREMVKTVFIISTCCIISIILYYLVYLSSTKSIAMPKIVKNDQWIQFENVNQNQELHDIKVFGKDKECPAYFSSSLKENLEFLLRMRTDSTTEKTLQKLGLADRSSNINEVLSWTNNSYSHKIKSQIPVIVCAASSNHFQEIQAFFQHIDEKVRPHFPDIKVVFYDIGLKEMELNQIIEYGKCDIRRFQFEKYPNHFKILHLCAWKPVIIQEVLQETGFVMYMDSSIRPRGETLQQYFTQSETTGHIFRSYIPSKINLIPYHTFPGTFQYFNIIPCLFHGISEIESGHIIMRNNNLVSRIIMRSWLTCALQEKCIMPSGAEHRTKCYPKIRKYHKCHREDQSALSIIVIIVYHSISRVPLFDMNSFTTERGERSKYFSNLFTSKGT